MKTILNPLGLHTPVRACVITLLSLFGSLHAQQVPPPSAAPASQEAKEDPIVLSPFAVQSSRDVGYQAASTLAGTRLQTDLKDLGSAISVYTKKFLEDTGATNNQDLLIYATNTETGGPQGNFAGLGDGPSLGESGTLIRPNNNNRVRGLTSADTTRNLLLTDIPWDNYNIDRVDIQRGPNSILYGLGSPAGIINATLSPATFYNSNKVEARFGSYGSTRGTFNFNRELIRQELAIRVAGLYDDKEFQQKPAFSHEKRLYGALKWEPKFLKKGVANTTLNASFETGRGNSNRPRSTPPGDLITAWYTRMNKAVYNPLEAGSYLATVPGSGAFVATSPNFSPNLDQRFGGPMVSFLQPGSSVNDGFAGGGMFSEFSQTDSFMRNANGAVGALWGGTPPFRNLTIAHYPVYARQANLRYASTLAPYKNQSLTSADTFDFYNNLLDGPSKGEWLGFDAAQVSLTQTFFRNRSGFELVYYRQNYDDGQLTLLGSSPAISVDIMTHFPDVSATNPRGTPNPNVGRPLVYARQTANSSSRNKERETMQATAFVDLKTDDFLEKSFLTKLIGRHTFTGFFQDSSLKQEDLSFYRYLYDRDFGLFIGDSMITTAAREVFTMSYLGGSLLGTNSAQGAGLSRIMADQRVQRNIKFLVFDSHWNAPSTVSPAAPWNQLYTGANTGQWANPANYVGYVNTPAKVLDASTSDRNDMINRASLAKNAVQSKAFTWQGRLFDSLLIPTFGYRKDTAKVYSLTKGTAEYGVDRNDPSYVLPATPRNTTSGISRSWSVVAHVDKILPRLPMNSQVSLFYNESSNFQPNVGNVDMYARPLAAPSGETKDYGFVLTTLNNKVTVKVNWYQTDMKNAVTDIAGSWFLGWAESYAFKHASLYYENLADPTKYGTGWTYQPRAGQTVDQARAEQLASAQGYLNNMPSAEFWRAWSMTPTLTAGANTPWSLGGAIPAGLATTADNSSKGVEYELQLRPTSNWDIMIDASKVTAKNTNLAGAWREWIESRNKVFSGPAGDLRMWGGGAGAGTFRTEWNRTFYSNYLLFRQKEGSDVPEMRPWRFNLVNNYRFSHEKLKGYAVGGALRWQDKVGIGYPVVTESAGVERYDIARPYMGPAESNIDLWASYGRKLNKNLRWKVQLNVRNVFARKDLIPISTQWDGSPGAYRIPPGREWYVTNTFDF